MSGIGNTNPAWGTRRGGTPRQELARDCFEALLAAYDAAGSYDAVGKMLTTRAKPGGYSAGAICALLHGKYQADLSQIEAAIRSNLAAGQCRCPVLGGIERKRCLQVQTRPFRASSSQAVNLWRACRGGCPHYIGEAL